MDILLKKGGQDAPHSAMQSLHTCSYNTMYAHRFVHLLDATNKKYWHVTKHNAHALHSTWGNF